MGSGVYNSAIMKPRVLFVFVLLFSCSCFAADVKDVDGNRVLEYCTSSVQFMDNGSFSSGTQSTQASWCTGYVTGAMQALDLARRLSDMQDQRNYPCLAGVASGQAVRVIVKYLRENPEKLQERAVTLSLAALQRAFPCK
jgi:Rap1a immunity proteins